MTDDEVRYEQRVKLTQMEVDIEPKRRQLFWETPRNLAIVVGTAIAVADGLVTSWAVNRRQAIQVQLLAPLPTLTVPAPTHRSSRDDPLPRQRGVGVRRSGARSPARSGRLRVSARTLAAQAAAKGRSPMKRAMAADSASTSSGGTSSPCSPSRTASDEAAEARRQDRAAEGDGEAEHAARLDLAVGEAGDDARREDAAHLRIVHEARLDAQPGPPRPVAGRGRAAVPSPCRACRRSAPALGRRSAGSRRAKASISRSAPL